MRRTSTRPAVTLMEVLIAIFILATGLVSVMAFFPLGALNMVRSVKDQRTGQLAQNSDALIHLWWKEAWLTSSNQLLPEEIAVQFEPSIDSLDQNYSGSIPLFNPGTPNLINAYDRGPSHPVLIDPLGRRYGFPDHVGGMIDRVSFTKFQGAPMGPAAARPHVLRLTTLPDGMSFDKSGAASFSSNQLDRGYRYSTAWMLQREHNSARSDCHLWILTFDNRQLELPPDGQEEAVFSQAAGTLNALDSQTLILKSPVASLPRARKGGWIMVAYYQNQQDQFTKLSPPRWKVSFHRVTAIEDSASGGTNDRLLSLEQPVQSPLGSPEARVIVFENLAEVFYRGVMSPLDRP